jgi:hypothetical protein
MYPEYVEIEGKRYKINTDFRVAIECNRIAEDDSIGNLERALAIIYTLFGDEGINTPNHYEKLLELAQKYLLCGNEFDSNSNEKPDMDFIEDYGYIWASMMSDYNGLDIDKENIHWWKFNELLNGLSNSEMGNCCVLNRIRNLRTFDISQIKDHKEKEKIIKAKKQVQLKKNKTKASKENLESAMKFYQQLGILERSD